MVERQVKGLLGKMIAYWKAVGGGADGGAGSGGGEEVRCLG